jgi:hypothetical protein
MAAAHLAGTVSLYLLEPTTIKDIQLVLTGKAKVQWNDGSR